MSILMKAFEDKFGNTCEEIDHSIEHKLRVLGLSEEDKTKIEHMPFKNIDKDQVSNTRVETICLKDLLGFNRRDMDRVTSWLNSLGELRNSHNFNSFKDKTDFYNVLNDEVTMEFILDGLPSVTEFEGKYYVSGNGKHRLTIAKCIGVETAKVITHKSK